APARIVAATAGRKTLGADTFERVESGPGRAISAIPSRLLGSAGTDDSRRIENIEDDGIDMGEAEGRSDDEFVADLVEAQSIGRRGVERHGREGEHTGERKSAGRNELADVHVGPFGGEACPASPPGGYRSGTRSDPIGSQ